MGSLKELNFFLKSMTELENEEETIKMIERDMEQERIKHMNCGCKEEGFEELLKLYKMCKVIKKIEKKL